jgi:hypothetical protein
MVPVCRSAVTGVRLPHLSVQYARGHPLSRLCLSSRHGLGVDHAQAHTRAVMRSFIQAAVRATPPKL